VGYPRKGQTFTATPAKPGELSSWFRRLFLQRSAVASPFARTSVRPVRTQPRTRADARDRPPRRAAASRPRRTRRLEHFTCRIYSNSPPRAFTRGREGRCASTLAFLLFIRNRIPPAFQSLAGAPLTKFRSAAWPPGFPFRGNAGGLAELGSDLPRRMPDMCQSREVLFRCHAERILLRVRLPSRHPLAGAFYWMPSFSEAIAAPFMRLAIFWKAMSRAASGEP
jgi:hypothetical protein